jgi:hypothetical protein
MLRKTQKTRIRREKCNSKILVNGFIVARVSHKPKPKVAPDSFATVANLATQATFPHILQ